MTDAGRAFRPVALDDAWATVTGGATLSWEQRGLLGLARTQVAAQAAQAIALRFPAAGVSAIYASTGVERCLCDGRTAAQPIGVTPTTVASAGQRAWGRDVHPSGWSIDDGGRDSAPRWNRLLRLVSARSRAGRRLGTGQEEEEGTGRPGLALHLAVKLCY